MEFGNIDPPKEEYEIGVRILTNILYYGEYNYLETSNGLINFSNEFGNTYRINLNGSGFCNIFELSQRRRLNCKKCRNLSEARMRMRCDYHRGIRVSSYYDTDHKTRSIFSRCLFDEEIYNNKWKYKPDEPIYLDDIPSCVKYWADKGWTVIELVPDTTYQVISNEGCASIIYRGLHERWVTPYYLRMIKRFHDGN